MESISPNLMMQEATRFVSFRGTAGQNDRIVVVGRLAVDEALGTMRILPADRTDRSELPHSSRNRQERRHWPEWLSPQIYYSILILNKVVI